MIIEIGEYSLILSLFISLYIALNPYLERTYILKADYQTLKSLSVSQFFSLLTSLFCLLICFVYDDFSLSYVTSNAYIHNLCFAMAYPIHFFL